MANYFEAISDTDEAIVIDDTFKNIEVLDSFPLSQCRFITQNDSNHGAYSLLRTNPKTALVGIGLNDLNGLSWFMFNSDYGHIYFYDNNSGIEDVGLFPVRRNDISAVATVYLLGFAENDPSAHGIGLEIYNADGKIVYSSVTQHLDILACTDGNTQMALTDNMVFMTLGTDHAADIKASHHKGWWGAEYTKYPAIEVANNVVSVSPHNATVYYFQGADMEEWEVEEHIDKGSLFFSYLIGKLT